MLELDGVSTRYGPITMLRDVSLALEAGRIACLLGPNGSGKTTLIRTILGIVRPVRGVVRLGGARIDGLRTHEIVKLGIGVVPEGRRVFPKMTVEENLRMGAFVEWTAADVAARREYVYGLFPRLAERRRQKAATMSGGEQAMLAMGRALMGRPKLLLLDEPSLGLAPLLVEQLFGIIRAINEGGTTVFLIEQNARKTLEIAHHGFVLQKGEIVGHGSARELAASEVVRHAYLRA
ncbi:MAG: ABC transporter ATP-binding protein [Candidatus Rokubacteria bacterium 13_1_40CM_4_69_39]|nr:MAG: ABC transporter ATP-binding protein [Candidatus Rokubacteria bacterium 13_1_40CM_4_69_39]OLD74450.1 MAG: ABC transporter ATP-binding protein [Candidatus Rokubacteria bacterium 13_1_20CM_4_70_14]PYM47568.1 MAG: ABC transporter ATP-binding protein [Candidatus Rokubacteria bacterium]